MYQLFLSLAVVFTFFLNQSAHAELVTPVQQEQEAVTELKGYGAFSHLNKDWMLLALYSNAEKAETIFDVQSVQRLEIKIATEKFTSRRFRALWLETLSIEHGAEKIVAMEQDLQQFFDVLQGPLIEGDTLIIERTAGGTGLTINYYDLAVLSEEFLPMLVQSLVGKHPPTQALKSGLLGEDSLRDQMKLSIRFERLEPTLPRISEVSRWRKRILASN